MATVEILTEDFNGAKALFEGRYAREWGEIEGVLRRIPLCVKASDQAGMQGDPKFDPKATNAAIESGLGVHHWKKARIPEHLSFLGKDVDFTKTGIIVEAQFSNYPFAINNVVRTMILIAEQVILERSPVSALVLITKGKMFPAAQSVLYYEQAVLQMTSLVKYKILGIPTRVVGLVERIGTVSGRWTDYPSKRYSRTIESQRDVKITITPSASGRESGVCKLSVL